jgi:SAM-dependent methyltransferase
LWQFALAQGVIAAGLSWLWRQPVWWLPLHLGFFPVILLAQQLNLPAWVYLAAFLLLVLFYWSSFRTRVPLYLSDRKAWDALIPLLPQATPFRFIDIGSGFGDVPFYLEPRFPLAHFFGTEIAPAPWLISRVRAWIKHSRVTFLRRDYAALDLAEFEVVFAFLSPAAMPGVWQQAQSQMRSNSLLISLSFDVQSRQPDHVITLAEGARHTLYAWRM